MVVAHLPKGTVGAIEPVARPLAYLSIHRPDRRDCRWGRPVRRRQAEFERLRGLGVRFTQEPAEMGPDHGRVRRHRGNLIQIAHQAG